MNNIKISVFIISALMSFITTNCYSTTLSNTIVKYKLTAIACSDRDTLNQLLDLKANDEMDAYSTLFLYQKTNGNCAELPADSDVQLLDHGGSYSVIEFNGQQLVMRSIDLNLDPQDLQQDTAPMETKAVKLIGFSSKKLLVCNDEDAVIYILNARNNLYRTAVRASKMLKIGKCKKIGKNVKLLVDGSAIHHSRVYLYDSATSKKLERIPYYTFNDLLLF